MTTVTKTLCSVLLLFLSCALHAQEKKVYLDHNYEKSKPSKATYYRIYTATDSGYRLREYMIKSDLLHMTGCCTAKISDSRYGRFIYYYDDGHKKSEGKYENNHRCGDWTYYYDSSQKISSVSHYINDSLEGSYHSYYNATGNLIEKGQYAHDQHVGVWTSYFDSTGQTHVVTTYAPNNKSMLINSYYRNGKLRRVETDEDNIEPYGKCYDTLGKEIPFTPLLTRPKPAYDLSAFIRNSIRYPDDARRHNVRGRILVQFEVGADGTISNINILQPLGYGCSEEAKRVIAAMPPWQPGVVDDAPVRVLFTQPITFALQ